MAKVFKQGQASEAKYPHLVMIRPPSRAIEYDETGKKVEGIVENEDAFIPLPAQFVEYGYQSMGDAEYQSRMADARYFFDYLDRLKRRGFKFKGFAHVAVESNRFARSIARQLDDVKVVEEKKKTANA